MVHNILQYSWEIREVAFMASISIFPKNIPAIWLTHKINAGMDYARNSQKWHMIY